VVIEKSFAIGWAGNCQQRLAFASRRRATGAFGRRGLGSRPITQSSLHKLFRRALVQPWEGAHFLDLNETIVAKELHHIRRVRRSGPTAENILRHLSEGAQPQAAE
jgi:pyruvate ferredoxin oxidoreductase alpha subunit